MKAIFSFLIIFWGTNFIFSQQIEEFPEKINFYPIYKQGKWHFLDKSRDTTVNKLPYDTIHFISYLSSTFFMAVRKDSFELRSLQLQPVLNGKYKAHIQNCNRLFIRQDTDNWICFSIDSSSTYSFIADSVKKINQDTYFFSKGKTGIFSNKALIDANYQRIMPFNKEEKTHYLILDNNKFGLLDEKGKIMIEPKAEIIENYNFGLIRYLDGNWKYLMLDGNIIDPGTNEIHFYSNQFYKIYSNDRTKVNVYLNNKRLKISDLYEDIFLLTTNNDKFSEAYYAVKKNNKIGLVDKDFKLIVPLAYEQIQIFDNYVLYLENELWGLMDKKGNKLTTANFATILDVIKTKSYFHLICLKEGKAGVVTNTNQVIIPFAYKNIEFSTSGYIVKSEKKQLGLFSVQGKEIVPAQFTKVDNDYSEDLLIFYKSDSRTIINQFGEILTKNNCYDYTIENSVLKCYYPQQIEVLVLKNGKIEEITIYKNIPSVRIGEKLAYGYSLSDFPESILELNQLTGLYASRKYTDTGLALKPTYKYCIPTQYSGIYAAINDSVELSIPFFPKLKTYYSYHILNCDVAAFNQNNTLSSDIFESGDFSSTEDNYILDEDDDINWYTNHYDTQQDQFYSSTGLLYTELLGDNYQQIYIGRNVQIVPIAQADISICDFFSFLNKGNNLWFSDIKSAYELMNPLIGIQFLDSKLKIRKISESVKEFKYKSPMHIIQNDFWSLYFIHKENNRWVLTNDLNFNTDFIDEVINFSVTTDPAKDYLIIEKENNNKQIKKGIISIFLLPITEVIYDEIVDAGALGFLVSIDGKYRYIDKGGEEMD